MARSVPGRAGPGEARDSFCRRSELAVSGGLFAHPPRAAVQRAVRVPNSVADARGGQSQRSGPGAAVGGAGAGGVVQGDSHGEEGVEAHRVVARRRRNQNLAARAPRRRRDRRRQAAARSGAGDGIHREGSGVVADSAEMLESRGRGRAGGRGEGARGPPARPRGARGERGRAIGKWRGSYREPRDAARVRRWLAETGEFADDVLVRASEGLKKAVAAIRAKQPPLAIKDLAVRGDDLIAAGVRPGPEVGEALARLLDEVLEDPSRNTKEYLLSRV